MSKLKPWIEDGAPEAISHLITAARTEQPSSDSLSRTLGAVGASIVTTSAATATGASLGSAASGAATAKTALFGLGVSSLKWALIGIGLGGAIVAAVEQTREPDGVAQKSAALQQRATRGPSLPSTDPSVSRTELPVVVPESGRAEAGVVNPEPSPKSSAASAGRSKSESISHPAALPPASAPPIDSERLAEEVRAIDDASTALTNGHSAEALGLLDDYDRRFPQRRFAPEALYLRMEALLRSGRSAEARKVAERFVLAYPKSPQSARARLLLKQTIP